MAKPSSDSTSEWATKILSPTAEISADLPPLHLNQLLRFLADIGVTAVIPGRCEAKDFYSDIVSDVLKPLRLEPGSVSFLLTVKPPILNYFTTIHGGALAAIAEAVSIVCAKTVFPEDKEIFLGEQSISYLSGATKNEEVTIDAKVVRKGRNVTVVGVEFRLKKTQKLIYLTRATFYNMPGSKL